MKNRLQGSPTCLESHQHQHYVNHAPWFAGGFAGGFPGGSPGGSDGEESACNVGDLGSILGLGRSPGEGNGNPLQYSFLESYVDRGAWRAAVHGVANNWTHVRD